MDDAASLATKATGLATDRDDDLALAARSDPAAFGLLYDRHRLAVYRYLRTRTASADDAAELTAVVFERALAAMSRYRPSGGGILAWLLRIARNAAIDASRRGSSVPLVTDFADERPLVTPEDAALANERRALLLAARRLTGGYDHRRRRLQVAAITTYAPLVPRAPTSADDVALDHVAPGRDPLETEDRQVERDVSAMDDQLGDGTADRRRLLDAVAAEAIGEQQVLDLRMAADDRVVVERVHLVVAGPRIREPDRIELRDAGRQCRPQPRLELVTIDLEREIGEVLVRGRRDAPDE